MSLFKKELNTQYYNDKLKNNLIKRTAIEGVLGYNLIHLLPKLNIFKLTSSTKKNKDEEYRCYDFVIEFLKKYSSLEHFKIPRGDSKNTPDEVTFKKNFESSLSDSNNNILDCDTPTNFGIINYYNKLGLSHTGVLIESNLNVSVKLVSGLLILFEIIIEKKSARINSPAVE